MRRWTEPLLWWTVLFAGYLAIISAVSVTELIVGSLTAAAGAGAAVAARRVLLTTGREKPRPGTAIRALPLLPGQILLDVARLTRPRLTGGFAEIRLPVGGSMRRGLATLILSASPGAYVTQVDPSNDTVTVHRIGTHPGAVERRAGR